MMKFEFIKTRRIWYTLSAIVIGLCLISLIFRGLNLGIDFTGGTIMELKFNKDTAVTTADIRDILGQFNLANASTVQDVKDPEYKGVMVRTKQLTQDEIIKVEEAIKVKYSDAEILRTELVGPSIGRDLKVKALLALTLASLGILAYISIRFQFKYALAAVLALLHDATVVLGMFSIFQWEVNTPFIAAILTILGYSINDTIVIFDKIRENVKIKRKMPFDELCNVSLLETLPRSINTSFTTLLTVLALLFFGGASIQVFMTALLIGVITGTYSSLFFATPLLVTWKKWLVDRNEGVKA